MSIPPGLINRRVGYTLHGERFHFDLSQSLFSSLSVDRGSTFLLEILVPHLKRRPAGRILDVGCGVGVLGIVLGRLLPGAFVRGIDRDALAVLFTRENARLNGVESAEFTGGIDAGSADDWSCIVSNLPAKAGAPVLDHLIRSFTRGVADSGLVGVVIVKTLEETAVNSILDSGAVILEHRSGAQHTVLIYEKPAGSGTSPPPIGGTRLPAAYIRHRQPFSVRGLSYDLSAAYNLSDFDCLGYGTEVAAGLLSAAPRSKRAAFWNPGQGHLPLLLYERDRPDSILLAGRDLLSLEISRLNLLQAGMEVKGLRTLHIPFPYDIDGDWDLLVAASHPDPEAAICDSLLERLRPRLRPDGSLLMAARSAAMFRILKNRKGWRVDADRKRRGYRGIRLRKSTGDG